MWTFYPFEKLVFKNVLKILLINIWIFIPLLIYMWGVEGVTVTTKMRRLLWLVYEYTANGSLHNCLNCSDMKMESLLWVHRLKDLQRSGAWTTLLLHRSHVHLLSPSLVITQESRKTATIMNGSDFSSREKFDGEILVLDFGLERGAWNSQILAFPYRYRFLSQS